MDLDDQCILPFQADRFDLCCCVRGSKKDGEIMHTGIMYRFFKNVYVPALMNKYVRPIVVIIFWGWVCLSIAVLPSIRIGLDQELSMEKESYLTKYFQVYFANNLTACNMYSK